MTTAQPSTTTLTVRRTIAASPGEVFDLWLDAEQPGSPWFGVARAIVHPEVDGLFYHLVQFEGRDWAHYGRFIVLDRPRRIEHSWVSAATGGLESIVQLDLAPEAGQTVVTLRHSNVPDDELGRSHAEGWGQILDAIAERFARR